MADPLTKARKFVRENPLTAEREGVDIAIEYAGECRKERAALLSALRDLMDDYLEAYDSLTDGQYGKPTTAAAKRAASLLMKLSK